MSQISLVAETGRAIGSGAAKRLRAAGKIPGTVYGHGMTPVSIAVDHRELRHALSGPAGVNAVVQLDIDGKKQPTVVKELQRDPVRRSVRHIDFIVVRMDEAITVDVPIVLEGEAKALLAEGGILEHALQALPVNTTPANIPTEIVIDVTDLAPGDVVRVEDLALPAGCTTDLDPDTLVVVGASTRAAVSAAEGEGEGEAAAAEGEGSAESAE
jgi:large subunit ribosomal protein L25